jgi:hypothetical protein
LFGAQVSVVRGQAPVVAFEFVGAVFEVEDAADADEVDPGDEFGGACEPGQVVVAVAPDALSVRPGVINPYRS